jgi:hypothetical protein
MKGASRDRHFGSSGTDDWKPIVVIPTVFPSTAPATTTAAFPRGVPVRREAATCECEGMSNRPDAFAPLAFESVENDQTLGISSPTA